MKQELQVLCDTFQFVYNIMPKFQTKRLTIQQAETMKSLTLLALGLEEGTGGATGGSGKSCINLNVTIQQDRHA